MTRSALDPDVMLEVRLSAVVSRHGYDADPAELLAELRAVADGRDDILAKVAGIRVGWHEADPHLQETVSTLRGIPGAEPWIEIGRARSGSGHQHRRHDQASKR